MVTDTRALADDGLIARIEYILDPTASAVERMHRRSHLTNHDLRRMLNTLRSKSSPIPAEVGGLVEKWREMGRRNCICERMVPNPKTHHPMCPVVSYDRDIDTILSLQAERDRLREAVLKSRDLLDCVKQRSATGEWWIDATDPESAVCEVDESVRSALGEGQPG